MSTLFSENQTVRNDTTGGVCTMGDFIGRGDRTEVYHALSGERQVAVKWFARQYGTVAQHELLEKLIRCGPPARNFLWPMALASADQAPGFGYLMPLLSERSRGLDEVLAHSQKLRLRATARAGVSLAEDFRRLHAAGFCWGTIGIRHIWLDLDNGDVSLGGNDRIMPLKAGAASLPAEGQLAAPELVQGEISADVESDRYSLAAILFCLLAGVQPIEAGRFVFGETTKVPEKLATALANWQALPRFVRVLFTNAFTFGLKARSGRSSETEWLAALSRLQDNVIYCAACGVDNFHDAETSVAAGRPGRCRGCRERLRLPPRLFVGRNVVLLGHDVELFPHHVDESRLYDFSQPIASVSPQSSDNSLWRLRNLSSQGWVCNFPDGQRREVPPGHTTPMANGLKIHFGKAMAEVRWLPEEGSV